MNFKNLKIVKEMQKVSPKLKWLMYDSMKEYKINSEYLDMFATQEGLSHSKIEAMVREMLSKEFKHIENSASFDFLTDAVVHRIKVKQLEAMGDFE